MQVDAHNFLHNSVSGAILSGVLLRRPFGGILPAAAIGTVLGTIVWAATETR